MRARPWPIVIIAVFHFLAPLANILWAAGLQKMGLSAYLTTFFKQASALDYIELFALFPVAGFCVYFVKAWSYAFYNLIMIYSFYQNYLSWKTQPEQFPLALLAAFYLVNTITVSYFLIPEVRKTYFDKKHRWWESKPRYFVQLMGNLFSNKINAPCRILNISDGGAFIECTALLEMNDPIKIEFSLLQIKFPCDGTVVHVRGNGKKFHGYGIKLKNPEKVKHLIEALKILRVSNRDDKFSLWHDFVDWFKTATSIEAWLPQLEIQSPEKMQSTPESAQMESQMETNVVNLIDFSNAKKSTDLTTTTTKRPEHWPNGLPRINTGVIKKAA